MLVSTRAHRIASDYGSALLMLLATLLTPSLSFATENVATAAQSAASRTSEDGAPWAVTHNAEHDSFTDATKVTITASHSYTVAYGGQVEVTAKCVVGDDIRLVFTVNDVLGLGNAITTIENMQFRVDDGKIGTLVAVYSKDNNEAFARIFNISRDTTGPTVHDFVKGHHIRFRILLDRNGHPADHLDIDMPTSALRDFLNECPYSRKAMQTGGKGDEESDGETGKPYTIADAVKDMTLAASACRDERLHGVLKTYVESAQCSNPKIEAAFQRANYKYMDLITWFTKEKLRIFTRVDAKEITEAQGLDLARAAWQQIFNEQERRDSGEQPSEMSHVELGKHEQVRTTYPYPRQLAKLIVDKDWPQVRSALTVAYSLEHPDPVKWDNKENGHEGVVLLTGGSDAKGCRQFRVTRIGEMPAHVEMCRDGTVK